MTKIGKKRLLFAGTLLMALLWVAPLFITLVDSFGGAVPGEWSLVKYRSILIQTPVYLKMFWNSVVITLAVLLGSIPVSLLGAYGFTVLKFRGKEAFFFLYLIVMLLPLQVTLMPNYMIASFLNMEESYPAIILPALFQPFGVFLLRQQMRQVPRECVDAAQMDGAGKFRLFWYIYLPLVRPGVAALAMLLVIEYWNLVDQVIVFIRDVERYPLSVFLVRVNESANDVSGAAAVFYCVPILATLFYGHDYLKQGIGLLGGGER